MFKRFMLVPVVLILLAVFAAPGWAEGLNIHGEISAQYNDLSTYASVQPYWQPGMAEKNLWSWSIDLWWANPSDKWRIGTNLICFTNDFSLYDDFLPKARPVSQYYQIYVSYRPVAWLELSFSDQCLHNFAQGIELNQYGPITEYRDMNGYGFKVAVAF
jgi:hypothetical protein